MHVTRNTTEDKQRTTLETCIAFIGILLAEQRSSMTEVVAEAVFRGETPQLTELIAAVSRPCNRETANRQHQQNQA